MQWKFKSRESLQTALTRIAPRLLQRVAVIRRDSPARQAQGVHELRVIIKRLRALLRLLRPVIAAPLFTRQNTQLRHVARRLSPLRDNTVTQNILARYLLRPTKQKQPGHVRPWTPHNERAVQQAALDLSQTLRDLKKVQVKGAPSKVLRPILTNSYRQSRRSMSRALTSDLASETHEWRKRTKDLFYQLQMLPNAGSKWLHKMVRRLDKLQERLGKERDLLIAKELLQAHPGRYGGKARIERPLKRLDRQSRRLRQQSIVLGAKVFADKSRKFARRVGRAAKAGSWKLEDGS